MWACTTGLSLITLPAWQQPLLLPLLLSHVLLLLLCCCVLSPLSLAYLSSPAVLVCASCVSGLLEALTPLSIITGAIMLFQAMQHTKVWDGVAHTVYVCGRGKGGGRVQVTSGCVAVGTRWLMEVNGGGPEIFYPPCLWTK